MSSRLFEIVVVVLWLAAMSWLVTTKIITVPSGGDHNASDNTYLDASHEENQVTWSVSLDHVEVGSVVQTSRRTSYGETSVESVVQFDQLPIHDIIQGFLGPVGSLVKKAAMEGAQAALPLVVKTTLRLDSRGVIRNAAAQVDMRDEPGIMRMTGLTVHDRFRYSVEIPNLSRDSASSWQTIYKGEFDVGEVSLLSDSVMPYSRLSGLHKGKTWTMQSIRPLAMLGGADQIRARVVGRSEIMWSGKLHWAYRVEFEDADLDPSEPVEPLNRIWVLDDHRIIRQRVRFGRSFVILERWPDVEIQGMRSLLPTTPKPP